MVRDWQANGRGYRRREALCVVHLAAKFVVGGLSDACRMAEHAAAAAVVEAHAAEYAAELDRQREDLVREIVAHIPPDVQSMVETGRGRRAGILGGQLGRQAPTP